MSIKDLVPRFGRKQNATGLRRRDEDSVVSFQREMNRLFDDFFRGFGLGPALNWNESAVDTVFSPSVDVSETGSEVKVSAELPGMEEKDVTVELSDNVLTIRGEKKEEQEEKGRNWYRREQSYGSFNRVVPLPANVNGEKAKARFKKGKLTINIPKLAEDSATRRSVKIETE